MHIDHQKYLVYICQELTIFKIVYNFYLYKIIDNAESVNPYDNRTSMATSARQSFGNGVTGSLRLRRRHIAGQIKWCEFLLWTATRFAVIKFNDLRNELY